MTLLDGDPPVIGGYRIQSRLGVGGMGVVYRASSLSGRQVAVKVIRPELAQDAAFRDRFRREVAAARQVSGAFTAPVVDADADAETPWLATLFIAGPSLAERVVRQGPLPAAEVRRLAAGLAEALRDIHRAGLVHRDLKPGNVLLADDGPRVIDFGIARAAHAAPLTSTGVAVGTPPFMAPEQFRRGEVSAATDVFSLGSVLVHAATGHGPFDGEHTHAIGFRVVYEDPDLTGLPDELRPLVEPCLAKEPGQRPTLEQLLGSLTVADQPPAPPTSPTPPTPPARTAMPPAPSVSPVQAPPPAPAPTPSQSPPPVAVPAPVPASDVPLPAAPGPTQPMPRDRRSTTRRTVLVVAAAVAVVAAAVTVPLLADGSGDGGGKGSRGKSPSSPSPVNSGAAGGGSQPLPCPEKASALRGSGSSAQKNVVDAWVNGYLADCPGHQVDYAPVGVGAGIDEFTRNKADFVLTDAPMTAAQAAGASERCGDGGAVHLPLSTTPAAVVVNLAGIDELALSAKVLAQIYQGGITRWNDERIAGLNPGTSLPDQRIVPAYVSGASSTTRLFGGYLAAAAPAAWPHEPSAEMPGNVVGHGTRSTTELAALVKSEQGALGYLPLGSAESLELTTAGLAVGTERAVEPTKGSVRRGAEAARLRGTGPDLALDADHTTAESGVYPLVGFGYAVVCRQGNGPGAPRRCARSCPAR